MPVDIVVVCVVVPYYPGTHYYYCHRNIQASYFRDKQVCWFRMYRMLSLKEVLNEALSRKSLAGTITRIGANGGYEPARERTHA